MNKIIFFVFSATIALSPKGEIVSDAVLKRECVKATLFAIQSELNRYETKLKAAHDNKQNDDIVLSLKKKIKDCQLQFQKFSTMNYDDYVLKSNDSNQLQYPGVFGPVMPPIVKQVTVTFTEECKQGSTLYIDGITKSGPFYHVAGVINDEYKKFKPGKRYKLKIYLVYKKEYFDFIHNYYVFVSHYEKM